MALPYYDLAIAESQLEAQTQRERVAYAIKLGWDAVGLVHQAAAKLTEQDRCRCWRLPPVSFACRQAVGCCHNASLPLQEPPLLLRNSPRLIY